MVVAVRGVRVVQVPVDEVVDVITVWHRFVSTTFTVDMIRLVITTHVRHAAGRVHHVDRERALIEMSAVRTVQMSVVKKVEVITVTKCGVAARRVVPVIVVVMAEMGHGRKLLCFLQRVTSRKDLCCSSARLRNHMIKTMAGVSMGFMARPLQLPSRT